MCVVIIVGINQNPCIEVGIHFTKEYIREIEDPYFFKNNFNDRKAFLSSSTSSFKEKTTPYFIR